MIIKATSIPHGQAMTNYTTKNHRADMVKTNLLSDGLPPMGMWDEMVLHLDRFKKKFERKPIIRTSIRIESSPSMEECKYWTMADWKRYEKEVIAEMDKVDSVVNQKGEVIPVKPTNMANSQYFAALHHDSKSGIPHLHWVVNRIDKDGNINDCHHIGRRAILAAQRINQRHGWENPMDIYNDRVKMISDDCMDILKSMISYNPFDYIDQLTAKGKTKGYSVKAVKDKQNNIVNYVVLMGNSKYKASELGKSKNLTMAHLSNTYTKCQLLGYAKNKVKDSAGHTYSSTYGTRQRPSDKENIRAERGSSSSFASSHSTPVSEQIQRRFIKLLNIDDEDYKVDISHKLHNELAKVVPEYEDDYVEGKSLMDVSLMLMMGYFDAATSMSESCGGGGSVSTGWGRDKDDDDEKWARKCAAQAHYLLKPFKRTLRR